MLRFSNFRNNFGSNSNYSEYWNKTELLKARAIVVATYQAKFFRRKLLNMDSSWQRKKCTSVCLGIQVGSRLIQTRILVTNKLKKTKKDRRMLHTHLLTAPNVYRWQLWCLKKSWSFTCKEILTRKQVQKEDQTANRISKAKVNTKA